MFDNSRLKATKIIGQRKAFYRKRISESSCARKETVDKDIIVTSRNGNRKIMQSIRIKRRPPSRIRKWNQFSQFRRKSTKVMPIEKTSTGYISIMCQGFKGGSKWRTNSPAYIHFCSLSNNSKKQVGVTAQTWLQIFHTWPNKRFIETQSNLRRKKLHRTSHDSNFLGGKFWQ